MGTWQACLDRLEGELTSQQFNTWIRPLQAIEENDILRILAPNQFVLDWVNSRFLDRINAIVHEKNNRLKDSDSEQLVESINPKVFLEIGHPDSQPDLPNNEDLQALKTRPRPASWPPSWSAASSTPR